MRIPSLCFIVGLLSAAAVGSPAAAAGLGDGTTSTPLGRPLEFRAVMRLAAGESLEPACVRATVAIGDNVVPGAGVGILVTTGPDDSAVIRVRTLNRIDEPIVTVSLEAGCASRIARRYTVFADPPASEVPVVALAPAAAGDAASAPSAARPAEVRRVAAAEPPVAEVRPRAADAAPRPAPPAGKPKARPRRPATAEREPPAPAPARARLRLDAPAEMPVALPEVPPAAALSAETLALVDQANEAVKAAIAAASASQARIAALESGMKDIAEASARQQALIEQLSARAAAAEGGSRWLWPLALLAAALAALTAWLWVRLRGLERERRESWLAAARGPGTPSPAPAPEPPTPSRVPLLVERGVRNAGVGSLGAGLAPQHVPSPSEFAESEPAPRVAAPALSAEQSMQQTQPLVPGSVPPRTEARDVTAEELIDLEQQAEFFVVLGQDDAAIDLLVSHLRDTGGASPLPYLKLLDIYHRLGDREAYERTRSRFNHRFNAHAPAWDAPHAEGKALEDYPQVVRWIQQVWPQPLDAMAELESLLFRRDEGELFDLPAYRELLMLYGLARDLLDAEPGGRAAAVDVLLPLNDAPAFAPTSPRPYFGDDGMDAGRDGQPTAPLDLDLGPEDSDSVFDTTRR